MITRPSEYDPEIGEEICRRIAEGETLLRITGPDRDEGIPGRSTIYDWLLRHDDFRLSYCLARLAQAEAYAEQVIAIADGVDEGCGSAPRDLARDKLRIDARRWIVGVMTPHVYERLAELSEAKAAQLAPLSNEETAARIIALLDTVRRRKLAEAEATGELADEWPSWLLDEDGEQVASSSGEAHWPPPETS